MNILKLYDRNLIEKFSFQTQYAAELVKNTEYVLCQSSAAEYLGLCNCSLDSIVYAYNMGECKKHNISYFEKEGVKCTTVNQTINDLLANNQMDEQIVLESLAEIFFDINGDGYKSLLISPENQIAFDHFAPMAKQYYSS